MRNHRIMAGIDTSEQKISAHLVVGHLVHFVAGIRLGFVWRGPDAHSQEIHLSRRKDPHAVAMVRKATKAHMVKITPARRRVDRPQGGGGTLEKRKRGSPMTEDTKPEPVKATETKSCPRCSSRRIQFTATAVPSSQGMTWRCNDCAHTWVQ